MSPIVPTQDTRRNLEDSKNKKIPRPPIVEIPLKTQKAKYRKDDTESEDEDDIPRHIERHEGSLENRPFDRVEPIARRPQLSNSVLPRLPDETVESASSRKVSAKAEEIRKATSSGKNENASAKVRREKVNH